MTTTLTSNVGDVVHAPIATVAPSATLEAAASLLAADQVGLLVVVDPTGVRGVLSERDIVAAVADGVELAVERVADFAVTDVLMVDEASTIRETATLMGEAQVRHLLVTRRGTPVGVVSIRDLLAALLPTA
ncbi:CBS domain-containing protein [Egicoccus sp. AB-alg2]|uniref:CBS domain-containing protein n=1 Tax=Egicoccus sp. AB-alg2 TaxID=3242693 RepID=UPI00359E265F